MNSDLPDTTRISARVWIIGAVVLAVILAFGIPASRHHIAALLYSLQAQ